MRLPLNSPPTPSTLFGVPDSYAKFGRHSGIDYPVGTGTPVFAPVSGQLTTLVSPTGGNMVVIQGTDGYYHRLMHNSAFSRGNGAVGEGNEVAKSGNSGLSTGPHLHWDVNREGTYPTSFAAFVDPLSLMKGDINMDEVYKLLNERDKRMDKIEADISKLYEIVDQVNKNIEKLLASSGGLVDGDYHITKKG